MSKGRTGGTKSLLPKLLKRKEGTWLDRTVDARGVLVNMDRFKRGSVLQK